MFVEEGPLTITLHGLTLTATLGVLGVLLNQHKIWVRLKDRADILWRKHCRETGDVFIPLENGVKRDDD